MRWTDFDAVRISVPNGILNQLTETISKLTQKINDLKQKIKEKKEKKRSKRKQTPKEYGSWSEMVTSVWIRHLPANQMDARYTTQKVDPISQKDTPQPKSIPLLTRKLKLRRLPELQMIISQYDPIALALQETMVPESTISPDYIENYKLYLC